MGKASMPPGFRFSPTDIELVKYYLKRKVLGKKLHFNFIAEVDIYKYSPWDLPDKSCWKSGDLKWYFFCQTARKYQGGTRLQRATEGGYWKATGIDRTVLYDDEVSGWIKTLIFHTGRPPKGERTDWVMHEYRLEPKELADSGVPHDSYVLCMIFKKDGLGPKNGAQYGAPFKEEEWTDDEAEICSEPVLHANMPEPNLVLHANMPEPNLVLPRNCNSSITTSTCSPEGTHIGPSSESCVSDVVPPCNVIQPVSSNDVTTEKPHVPNHDDILSLLNCLTEGSTSSLNGNDKNEELGNVIHTGNVSAEPHFQNAGAAPHFQNAASAAHDLQNAASAAPDLQNAASAAPHLQNAASATPHLQNAASATPQFQIANADDIYGDLGDLGFSGVNNFLELDDLW